MTAIKPMLEAVSTDWVANVERWTVSCSNVSNRQDNTGKHLLCTVLSLAITDNDMPGASQPHKATLHFYHTKDKIQVQSSAIITPGTSVAEWLVKSLIEPLAAKHITANQQSIDRVNNAILSSANSMSWSCGSCHSTINASSSQVKDRPLACKRCSEVFHKRCSVRSGTHGSNWNKEPWFCAACHTTPGVTSSSHQSSVFSPCSPAAPPHTTIPSQGMVPPSLSTPILPAMGLSSSPLDGDTSIVAIQPTAGQPDPPAPVVQPVVDSMPDQSVPRTRNQPAPRFPASTRQRGSNIAILDPELEFQKAALDSCRSTIIQQEAEIKKLSEGIDIRNKKIMQQCLSPRISCYPRSHHWLTITSQELQLSMCTTRLHALIRGKSCLRRSPKLMMM